LPRLVKELHNSSFNASVSCPPAMTACTPDPTIWPSYWLAVLRYSTLLR
jgi:hypothetical protein